MKQQEQGISLRRSSFSNKIIPASGSNLSSFSRSTSTSTLLSSPLIQSPRELSKMPLALTCTENSQTNSNNALPLSLSRVTRTRMANITTFLRSLLNVFSFQSPPSLPTCRWLAIPSLSLSSSSLVPLGRKVTGTLFGHRKGHVTFAVQDGPQNDPALLVELAISTSALVREMSSGLIRIALECRNEAARGRNAPRLFQESAWTMYCNGKKCGCATTRDCTDLDWHVLSTIRTVSVGAGVIPFVEDRSGSGSGSEGELLYMRAKFERVVGSRDSEAFYMLNPDGNGGPELSIFLLRL